MNHNVLKVRMLGVFSLEYKGKEFVLDRNNSAKTTQLFQIVVLHARDGGISKAELINALYWRTDVVNQNGSLNNILFRLRKQLKAAGLPDSNYININGGMCTWDPEIPVWLDVCEFKKLVILARNEKEESDRLRLLMDVWKCYRGEFLPDMIGENWAAAENVKCRDEYFICAEELCQLLNKYERYEELQRISHITAAIYPFDEWQRWEIESLIKMSRFKQGMKVYKDTERLLFEEMGIAPSTKMQEQFQLMCERTSHVAGAIGDIKSRLKEKDEAVGAYYCSYQSFVDIYHVFNRMMERSKLSVFVILCTLAYTKESVSDKEEKEMSKILKEAIRSSIRKGDFYTKYNIRQYIIMLNEISQENCSIVTNRINKAFRNLNGEKKSPQIYFYVASLGEVCDTNTIENDDKLS